MVSVLMGFVIYPSTLLYVSVKLLGIDAQSNYSVIKEPENVFTCAELQYIANFLRLQCTGCEGY